MASAPLHLLRVAGTHAQVGRQVGEACVAVIRTELAAAFDELPAGRARAAQITLAARYREATREAIPWLVEELDGVAEGADVDPLELFSTGIEEIWYEPRLPKGRCSDLVATGLATTDRHTIVGHTNDLSPRDEDRLIAIEWAVDGEPVVFSVGIGPWLSVGFNAAGIAFTGNELSPNDERVGIPRLMQFRAMVAQPSVETALSLALHPQRASSYNHVVTSRDGDAMNVEGSATEVEITGVDDRGVFAHTNHYACDRMLPFEGDTDYAEHSAVRLRRAGELLAANAGSITTASMHAMLSDHENAPDSICRHVAEGVTDRSKTVFWCAADVTEMRIAYGRGNPCDSIEQTYGF